MVPGTFDIPTRTSSEILGFDSTLTIVGFLAMMDDLRHKGRKRIWTATAASGRHAEDLTHRYLQSKGMRVVARNWRVLGGRGEVDLVAWDEQVLVFVEVKSLSSGEFSRPERAVNKDKMFRIGCAAREYLRRAELEKTPVRFDIASVILGPEPVMEYFRDAFLPFERLVQR